MKNKKIGKIIRPANVKPEPHEIYAAEFLANLGYDIEFLEQNYTKGATNTDIVMNGLLWEIKSPHGEGKHTLRHAFYKASKQSKNIIIDLRKMKMSDDRCISIIQHLLNLTKSVRKLIVITKTHKLLDIK